MYEITDSSALNYILAKHIYHTLARCQGSVAEAAKVLKVGTWGLYKRCRRYGIKYDRKTKQVRWDENRKRELKLFVQGCQTGPKKAKKRGKT